MSTTTLRLAGQTVTVLLTPDAGGFVAAVDTVAHPVALLGLGPATLPATGVTTRELAFEIDGVVRHAVVACAPGRVLVALDGRVYTFETGDAADARTAATRAGSGVVVAPMPGKVIAVLVQLGDAVEPGQPIVVLEAMKMETTLAAEIAGTVTAVRHAAGDLVDGGAVLAEITPA